jgi:RimJ/RimL family protein N-acetyltransferase
MIKVRQIQEDDSKEFLELCKVLDKETHFMLLEPSERQTTVVEQRARIKDISSSKNQIIIIAQNNEHLTGFIAGLGGGYRRDHLTVRVIIGILQAFTRQGLGTKLFLELERWALDLGAHRLELTVMTHNQNAIGLYKKMGFMIEGIRRHSLLVDGEYVDEYFMAKILP